MMTTLLKSTKRIPLLAAALAGSLLSAASVAKLTTPDAVTVKGVALPSTDQLTAYPVSLNDEIATKDKPASLEFTDGSKITVAAGSTVRLEQGKSGTAVRVLRGNVSYRLTVQSHVEILNASGQRIGGGMDARMMKALAATSAQQASSAPRRPTSSDAADSGASDLLARTYLAGHATAAGGTTSIVLPNGYTFLVTPNASGSYTITGVIVPVTLPGSIAPGSGTITTTSGPLIGATLTPGTGPGSSISITMPGQTAPLSPTQVNQQLTAIGQQTVAAATQSGQLPAGSTPTPPASPIRIPNAPAAPGPPPVRVLSSQE